MSRRIISKLFKVNLKMIITAFGNPLLDIIVVTQDNRLLLKHKLKEDDQIEVRATIMKRLIQDIISENLHKTVTAGGCAQNTLRVFQWLTEKMHQAYIYGSVGSDNEAILLKNLIEQDGVVTKYIVPDKVLTDDILTGTTISLVNGPHRSLVACLGAANILTFEDLGRTSIKEELPNSDLVYIEGFFLTNREEVAKYILNWCNALKLTVAFNLSGEYLCKEHTATLTYFIENSDIVLGNKREFDALRKKLHLECINELVMKILNNNCKTKKKKEHGNIVVITDGPNPIECHYGEEEASFFQHRVTPLSEDVIKDTTGAGDAFVGGFLAGLVLKKKLNSCTKLGCYAANEVIRQIGCTVPNKKPEICD